MFEKMGIIAFFVFLVVSIFLLCSVESRFDEMQKQIDLLQSQNVEMMKKQRLAEQDIHLLEDVVLYLDKKNEK